MRFLFSPVPVTGHLSPALSLMRRLVERGHDVCCLTGARFKRTVEATGAAHEPFRSAPDIEFERLTTLFPDRPRRAGIAQARWDLKLSIDVGADQYPDLLAVAREQQADAIVADVMSCGGQFVAETLPLPLAVLCPLNLFIPSRDIPPDGFGLAPNASALGRLRNRCLNWLAHDVVLRDVGRHLSDVRVRLGLPPSTTRFFEQSVTNSQLFLQPTIPSFEYPRGDLPDHVHFVGALLPSPPDTSFDPPAWWDELKEDRPVVLVTQGTVATDFDDLLRPAIRALADEDVLVVATTANCSLALGGNTRPANLRLEPFVPFARLMPFVDVMVTNGGYGGVHFALTHGVPLVVAGKSEDKAEVCARVAWSGVGVDLNTTRPTPAAVRDGVRRVLDESRYRLRAGALRDEFAAIDGPTRSAELLERLVRTGERVTRAAQPSALKPSSTE